MSSEDRFAKRLSGLILARSPAPQVLAMFCNDTFTVFQLPIKVSMMVLHFSDVLFEKVWKAFQHYRQQRPRGGSKSGLRRFLSKGSVLRQVNRRVRLLKIVQATEAILMPADLLTPLGRAHKNLNWGMRQTEEFQVDLCHRVSENEIGQPRWRGYSLEQPVH